MKEIKEKVKYNFYWTGFKGCLEKQTLNFFTTLPHSVERAAYTQHVRRNERAALAKARLGCFIWQAVNRADGTRICALCEGTESTEHILLDCESLKERGISSKRSVG